MVSTTTCQNQAADKCSTSYWTYSPTTPPPQLTPDPRNDLMLTYADGRSASATDTTYQTTYAYDAAGDLTSETTPPVAGSPSGRTTTYTYTDGTSSTGGDQGAVPPAGLPYQVTTPGGAVTTTLYYADGDVAQITDPDGQRTVYTYDGLGRKIAQTVYSDTYPSGLTTSYTYDANGDLATETDPAVTDRVTGAVHTAQTTTSYDPDGDVTSQTVADTDRRGRVPHRHPHLQRLRPAGVVHRRGRATDDLHLRRVRQPGLGDRPGRQRHQATPTTATVTC